MKAFCKLFMAYAISTCVYAQVPISVEALDEQGNNSGQLTLRLKLTNNTTDTLYNIHAKYFLNYERNRALNVSPYYMEGATTTIDTLGDYLAVNIGITKLAPGVFPNASGISLGMNYTDYNSFNKSDNFSYPGNNGFTETEKIPVYYGDVLLAGISPGMLPDANPISLISGSELLLDSTKRVRFAWREVEGANSYRLTILSASDSNVLVQKETEKNRIDTALNEGSYYWRVESSEYSVGNGAWDNIVDFTKQTWNTLHTFFNNIIIDYINPLIDTPLAARKDTYLLDPKWGEMAIDREWDRPHWHHDHYDEEEHYRCWVVGAQMLNHLYGGNITQDEIKLKFKRPLTSNKPMFNDSALYGILGAFLHYNLGGVDTNMLIINDMMPWVLNENTVLNRNDHSPTENEVKFWLNDSVPLYIWTHSHVMILDGYKKTNNNKFYVHIVNTDNDGHTAWSSLDSIGIRGFMAPQVTGEVRKTDSLIHWDHDEDGLKDYDEIFRFGTDPLNWDTDGDSIDDKTEIMSYTILEPIPTILSVALLGIDTLQLADIDNDFSRAEHDFDSDEGGISDGIEDKNKNGFQEENESSPYNAEDDFIQFDPILNIPDTFTIYALNELRLNDFAICWYAHKTILNSQRNMHCSIASESSYTEYAINLGRSVSIKFIASKGGILLRNHSEAIDPIKMYTLPNFHIEPELQEKAAIRSIPIHIPESLWPYKIPELPPTPTIGNTIKEVFHNETYTLKDGDNFNTLRVHPGGKINIEPGEMIIGNIQLEPESQIQFTEPGKRTVIHANGSTIWRSWTLNDDLEQVAKGFMLVQHGNETMTIEGQWAGTIFAPNADLILGQSFKVLYGRFLGKNVTVHQYSTVYNVNFNPEAITNLVFNME